MNKIIVNVQDNIYIKKVFKVLMLVLFSILCSCVLYGAISIFSQVTSSSKFKAMILLFLKKEHIFLMAAIAALGFAYLKLNDRQNTIKRVFHHAERFLENPSRRGRN